VHNTPPSKAKPEHQEKAHLVHALSSTAASRGFGSPLAFCPQPAAKPETSAITVVEQ
jgi:hypothetical protein